MKWILGFHQANFAQIVGFKAESMPLNVREWTCHNCGESHDRDINAAINIKQQIPQALGKYTPVECKSNHDLTAGLDGSVQVKVESAQEFESAYIYAPSE